MAAIALRAAAKRAHRVWPSPCRQASAYNRPIVDPRLGNTLKDAGIERYITDGASRWPRALSRAIGPELSPATIRNDADLEEMGFIASPHTSAGRIPTPGYRFFVDTLMVVKPLEQIEIRRLEEELHADHPQQIVNAAAVMLSQLTQFAGVVMTPRRREATFRHLEFLRLSERRVLLIIVTAENDVQNRILHTDRPYTQAQLIEATNFFNHNFAGSPLGAIRGRLADELRALGDDIAGLMRAAVDVGEGALSRDESLVVSGERNLLNAGDSRRTCSACAALPDLFEQKPAVAPARRRSRRSGASRSIGGRVGLLPPRTNAAS
jgi:heat-inducible transcriptional repressor